MSLLLKELFLSKAERDYLSNTDGQKIEHDYVCVKSRLHKKLRVFVNQELPLLLKRGYFQILQNFAILQKTARYRRIAWLGYRRRLAINDHTIILF